ncbi:MAG TPA: rhodanese-like domain-containing protein [Bacteroidales bacterium]|nr:rhodanese-like domain-containing protein [Bacteroidales bacterium]
MVRLFGSIILLFIGIHALCQESSNAVELLSPEYFIEEMKSVTNAYIIDVREPDEFKRERITGAINILSKSDFTVTLDTINKASYLFLYCKGGTRSQTVGEKFVANGFIHVYNLDGGLDAWKKKGLPLDKKKINLPHKIDKSGD